MIEPIVVLYVDDEPGSAEVVSDSIDQVDDGIEIVAETTVSGSFDKLASGEIDCVISDYDMAETDGLEFLHRVRAEYPDLPFILFTGKGSEAVASEALSAGATDYLQKQVREDQYVILANRVRNCVETARANEQRQRQLDAIETAQEGISILDWDGQFIYVNESYAELYGYEPADLIGEHWELLYPDGDEEAIREAAIPRAKEEGNWRGETTGLRADGSVFVEDHTLSTTDHGELICTVRDITDSLERDNRLDTLARRFEAVFDNPLTPIALLSPDGAILEANETALDIFGASGADITGEKFWKTPWRAHSVEIQELLRKKIERAADGEHVRYEVEHTTPEGNTGTVNGIIHPVRDDDDGNITELVAIARDITERKRREDALNALHEATQQFMDAPDQQTVADHAVETVRTVLDQPINGIWLYDDVDDLLRPVAATDKSIELIGTLPTYTGGESLSWKAFETGEVAVYDDLAGEQGQSNPNGPIQSEIILPLGEYGVMNVGSAEPTAFDDIDVSLARILADTVEAALDRAEREHESDAQRQELERQNERLNEFASIASHDLRNPLQVLRGSLDGAKRTGEAVHFDRAYRAVERMEHLIDDLLTLAREGTNDDDLSAVSVARLAEDCWHSIEATDAAIRIDIDHTVRANQSRLKQLLENLFANAVEHGGSDVTVTVGALDDTPGFYVEDDGSGISENEREQVFESGYSTSASGFGFGLSIVKQIVDIHGWDIRLTEGRNGGTRFEITGVSSGE